MTRNGREEAGQTPMTGEPSELGRHKLGIRWALWRASREPAATGFVSQPEPRTIGQYSRGRQMVAGNFLFAGHLVEAPGRSIWDIRAPDVEFAREVHGFAWLDDLAALGDSAARLRAQDWTYDWIARYGRGGGAGWSADLTARRLIRWINHAFFLMSGRRSEQTDGYFRLLTTQTVYLSRAWKTAPPGLPRFEALTGMICAGLALKGMGGLVGPAVATLAADCAHQIDAEGGIPTRNPEELLEVFTLLTWAAQALSEADRIPPAELNAALERIAPTLRALRHTDGGLARFHGGGRGAEGRLDHALATAGVRTQPEARLAMGFARLQGGRTSVIVDAAGPPRDEAGRQAHASSCAFELTSGRRPVVVSCGSGAPFGAAWRLAGRATASHSTLAIEGYSSSRFAAGDQGSFHEAARVSDVHLAPDAGGSGLQLTHDGWTATHGLSHGRDFYLTSDGRKLSCIEKLAARGAIERRRFEALLREGGLEGVAFDLRFHLHPDVDARLDLGGSAVSLGLKSGEIWVFRHDGRARMSLEPSVYLERKRIKPRASQQIVLSGLATDFETLVGWTLAKAQDTPLAIRDLGADEMPIPG